MLPGGGGAGASPLAVHVMRASADGATPAELQLVDLDRSTLRAIPLLAAPPVDAAADGDGASAGPFGYPAGLGAGPRGGQDVVEGDARSMDVAFAAPLGAGDGGLFTVHRGGEVVRWRMAAEAVQSALAEWRSIVGWREGGGGGGGDGAGMSAKELSIVRDFPSPKPAEAPKHGKVDETGAPHVGGNTWAGGTGGRDTAGLGGKGGPYRLSDGNPIHQISDAEKANVSPEALAAAREMAQKAWKERLAEIDMSEHEAESYERLLRPVAKEVKQLRVLLASREAKAKERTWQGRQTHGELDEARLVDGMAGERQVYKRRAETPPQHGAPQTKPKVLRFVLDLSGSMYYFNGHDRRLERCLQTAVMLLEAFAGHEHKYQFSMVGHSGDGPCYPLVEYGRPPADEKERLRMVQKMAAHTQFCSSGDYTLEAARDAIAEVPRRTRAHTHTDVDPAAAHPASPTLASPRPPRWRGTPTPTSASSSSSPTPTSRGTASGRPRSPPSSRRTRRCTPTPSSSRRWAARPSGSARRSPPAARRSVSTRRRCRRRSRRRSRSRCSATRECVRVAVLLIST